MGTEIADMSRFWRVFHGANEWVSGTFWVTEDFVTPVEVIIRHTQGPGSGIVTYSNDWTWHEGYGLDYRNAKGKVYEIEDNAEAIVALCEEILAKHREVICFEEGDK